MLISALRLSCPTYEQKRAKNNKNTQKSCTIVVPMAKVTLYRRPDSGSICLRISNGSGDSARHTLPITLSEKEWDGEHVTKEHPRSEELDLYLTGILTKARIELLKIQEKEPTRQLRATELKEKLVAEIFKEEDPEEEEEEEKPALFLDIYREFTETHTNARTREIYKETEKRILEFDSRELTVQMITRKWLHSFNRWLEKRSPSVNGRAIHFRNIRAAMNYAIYDEDILVKYPFGPHGFIIEEEETIHRDLTPEDLRKLFAYQPPTERKNKHHTKPLDYAVKYVDLSKLMFLLVGIPPVDLFKAKPGDFYGGKIKYKRAKTGENVELCVEPEAAALINKYKGTERLLSICENRKSYKSLLKATNKALKSIAKEMGLPDLTMYWMRHSWATIAYSLGADFYMVSDCLGHKVKSRKETPVSTPVYVNTSRRRIFNSREELNRAVLDYALYNMIDGQKLPEPEAT